MLKISVVTVCYNAAATIEETIKSVLGQTYPDVEYIIIDGGSTDGTVDVIKRYADRLAYWISEPDKGIYDAMNKGIAVATGAYINFMNAGDRFYDENVLSKSASIISGHKDISNAIFLGDIVCCRENKYLGRIKARPESSAWYTPPHQGMFIPVRLLREARYDISFRIIGDRELLCRLSAVVGCSLHTTGEITSIYDLSGISGDRRNAMRIYREAKSVSDKYYPTSSRLTICREYIKAVVKYISRFVCPNDIYYRLLYISRK